MSDMLDQHRDYVLRTVEERGVRLVRLWFTDVLGTLKSFAISPAELENALNDGMTFDGSSIDGYSRTEESDVLAIPDPNTFEVLPWVDPKSAEARVFCDIHNLDGSIFGGDPRQILRALSMLLAHRAMNSSSLPTWSTSTLKLRSVVSCLFRLMKVVSLISPPPMLHRHFVKKQFAHLK